MRLKGPTEYPAGPSFGHSSKAPEGALLSVNRHQIQA